MESESKSVFSKYTTKNCALFNFNDLRLNESIKNIRSTHNIICISYSYTRTSCIGNFNARFFPLRINDDVVPTKFFEVLEI